MMTFKRTQPTGAAITLNPGGTALLGTTATVDIDNAFPIEEILVFANVTCGATGPTLSGVDNILGIIKQIQLSIPGSDANTKQRTVVQYSGVGLLEYIQHTDDLDADTLNAVALSQGSSIANNLKFRVCYRIPLVHPAIAEPLRTRCLLPVHTYNQKPQLAITFEQSANMYSAGSLATVTAEVVLIRRDIGAALTNQILADGGFYDFDLLEKAYTVATGVSGDQRFQIATPGSYLNLLFRQYKGGATVTRAELDYDSNFGAESIWRIETGQVPVTFFRWHHLRTLNSYRQKQNSANQTYSPTIAGALASNTSFSPSASSMMDFLSDGVPSTQVAELGSVLDCNVPVKSGLLMELVGPVASVATNASTLYIGGHRLYGDLTAWQTLKTK